MTRKECLEQAMGCVLRDRQKQYGEPEDCFGMIARMWGAYLGVCVSAHDVAAMMALLKIARFRHNPLHEDNAVDCAGYAACMVECATAWEREGEDEAEGNAKGEVRLIFKSGDPVEWFSFRRGDAATGWHPAFYLGKAEDPNYHVVQDSDGTWQHVVHRANIRTPEAKYRPGDRVQFRDEIPSTSEPHWFDGTYVERLPDGGHAVKFGPHDHVIHCSDKDIRPAPKAEGVEELVQDAIQTTQELYDRIVDCNPAIYKSHKPTGEELAEMAEEDEKHG